MSEILERRLQYITNSVYIDIQHYELMNRKVQSSHSNFSVTSVSTYGHISNPLKYIVWRHWHILSSDPNVDQAFQDLLRLCYRRALNLRDHLDFGMSKCNPRRNQ